MMSVHRRSTALDPYSPTSRVEVTARSEAEIEKLLDQIVQQSQLRFGPSGSANGGFVMPASGLPM